LLTIVCLITNQIKRCLFDRIARRDHPCILALIDPGAKIHRSLARNIPSQIRYGFPRPPSANFVGISSAHKNIFVRKSSTHTLAQASKGLAYASNNISE